MTERVTPMQRVEMILMQARSHRLRPFTIAELATWCRRTPGKHFHHDLAQARQVGFERGVNLTACVRCSDGIFRMVYREEHEGDTNTLQALQTRATRARTYMRNAGRAGDWEDRNSPLTPAVVFGRHIAAMANSVEGLFMAEDQLMEDLKMIMQRGNGAQQT